MKLNWLDSWVASTFAKCHRELNEWDERPESGIDHERMPSLGGSGLEKFFPPERPPTPLPGPGPEDEGEAIETPLDLLLAILLVIVWPLNLWIHHRGLQLLEEALEEDDPIPENCWEEITTFLRESTWEHDDDA